MCIRDRPAPPAAQKAPNESLRGGVREAVCGLGLPGVDRQQIRWPSRPVWGPVWSLFGNGDAATNT
eukprot:14342937-Alexandrium_andersonii.AAC.1